MSRPLLRSAVLTLGVFGLAGCSDPSWQTKDIAGVMPELAFALTDENGKAVSEQDYAGQVALLFFGFTHCPDVCPTTLARLSAVANQLEAPLRDDLRVLFVSVDPARDDPQALRDYTEAFGPEFTGLHGDREALDELTRRYRVTYGYGDDYPTGDYAVSHSSAVFAFDRRGEARLLIRNEDSTESVANDLRRLLRQS